MFCHWWLSCLSSHYNHKFSVMWVQGWNEQDREFIILIPLKNIALQKQNRTQQSKPPSRIRSHHYFLVWNYLLFTVMLNIILIIIIFKKFVISLIIPLRDCFDELRWQAHSSLWSYLFLFNKLVRILNVVSLSIPRIITVIIFN